MSQWKHKAGKERIKHEHCTTNYCNQNYFNLHDAMRQLSLVCTPNVQLLVVTYKFQSKNLKFADR